MNETASSEPTLIDTHLHLDFDAFDDDREAVIERALAAGVQRMMTIGINRATCRRAVALAERYEPVYAAVGIHPNDATEWNDDAERELRDLAQHPKVVAIGEIGLDHYWKRVPHDVQKQVFRAQLALAADLQLPVIIHDREAHEDVLHILREWVNSGQAPTPPGVLHCFSGDRAMAEEALALGFYLGIDGPVTFKNARHLQALVADLPLDRLLVETDAPFLTPHPYRGKRNEPAYVRLVAEKIAELQTCSIETVARQTTRNAERLFTRLTATPPTHAPHGRKAG
nr:TatD family hydrolase [Ardenticatena sp.]